MAGLKYSKQRASIKDYLMHTTSHPTADTVYLHRPNDIRHSVISAYPAASNYLILFS